MRISEIKARIASLSGIPIQDIILQKSEDGTSRIEKIENNKFRVTYDDEAGLAHEFLHACFTPFDKSSGSLLLNALEDVRIDKVGRQYEPELCNLVVDNVNQTIETVAKNTEEETLKALKGLSIPLSCNPDPFIKDLPNDFKEAILKARKLIDESQSWETMERAYNTVSPFFPEDKNPEKQPIKGNYSDKRHISLADMKEKAEKREGVKTDEKIKRKINGITTSEMELPDAATQNRITKGIKDIILNKAIGKRTNSVEGKLNSRRLGRMPSKFLFTKKTAPSPKTTVWVLVDLSGSMHGEKTEVTVKFINTLRKIKSNDLKFQFRGFNTMYFKNDSIGFNQSQITQNNMYIKDPATGSEAGGDNDDGPYLLRIMSEIQNDTTPNKVLLILSDGEPTDSRKFTNSGSEGLRSAANKLEKSGINYVSIGILNSSVKDYYKKGVVVKSLKEFTDQLSRQIRRLIK